jgi:transcriptional regulator with XRE-family HTH domain
MSMDLEEFRQSEGLSYRGLAAFLGLTQGRHAMRWATGERWPDADKLQHIKDLTDGAVTIEAMHRRRLKWLTENRRIKLPDKNGQHVMI